MKEILFIILVSVLKPSGAILTSYPAQTQMISSHYKAELFYDYDSLKTYIETNMCNGEILIDIKNSIQKIIKQKEITDIEQQIKTIHKGYKWENISD